MRKEESNHPNLSPDPIGLPVWICGDSLAASGTDIIFLSLLYFLSFTHRMISF